MYTQSGKPALGLVMLSSSVSAEEVRGQPRAVFNTFSKKEALVMLPPYCRWLLKGKVWRDGGESVVNA
jgi:hypothetical protein